MGRKQQPAPAFSAAEETRADGLARRVAEIRSTPGHPSAPSLPYYQSALRDAKNNAAAGHPTAILTEWEA
ncbi:hypothetical protein RM780_03890 [Streptomyces sp. DSM 44917]|uniref:Transketolase n=1 Tax=Streptomyces boetiae TaxID=3075541 RepID=A0ABU2L3G9_9ACTN|nr:hypothetical protein [Streptomyces sp. DSM 44917]MDT0306104.1 hypothetical protein [Streptomyces sp. DSM 44917]